MKKRQTKLTASEALQQFKANNERYYAMEKTSENMDSMFGGA